MYIKIDDSEMQKWIDYGSKSLELTAVALKKGRQVDCVALCIDAPAGKKPVLVETARTLVEDAINPVHGVAFRSFSALERVLLVFGGTDSPCIRFDCDMHGENQEKFDLECHIDAADTPSKPVIGFLGAKIRPQDQDAEEIVLIEGKLDLVRGIKDELEEKYSLKFE